TAPANLFGASIDAKCWAAGAPVINLSAATNPFGGGGGGEFAEEPFLAVTAGQAITATAGIGDGSATANTAFGTVVAHGGSTGGVFPPGLGGAGGTGSANTIHFDGGPGGASSSTTGGGEGGSSAGWHSAGYAGNAGNTSGPATGIGAPP